MTAQPTRLKMIPVSKLGRPLLPPCGIADARPDWKDVGIGGLANQTCSYHIGAARLNGEPCCEREPPHV